MMRRFSLPRFAGAFGLILAFALAPDAGAQPKLRPKPTSSKPVTQADIERLEKKIDDQHRVIENLVRLQQQYAASLAALLFEGGSENTTVAKVEPKPDPKPDPKVDPKPDPKPVTRSSPSQCRSPSLPWRRSSPSRRRKPTPSG